MPYATVEDVEERLGSTLTSAEASSLEFFLADFSYFIDLELATYDKTAAGVGLEVLKMIVARRGVNFALSNSLDYGVASVSQSMEGMSTSISYASPRGGDVEDFQLTAFEKRAMGFPSAANSFVNIPLEAY